MLPTVAGPVARAHTFGRRATPSSTTASSDASGAVSAAGVPCRSRALTTRAASRAQVRWTEPAQAPVAAGWCERCPLATPCLLEALRLDAAYRRGEDPWGLSGVCGGVWFDPAHTPRRLTSQAPG